MFILLLFVRRTQQLCLIAVQTCEGLSPTIAALVHVRVVVINTCSASCHVCCLQVSDRAYVRQLADQSVAGVSHVSVLYHPHRTPPLCVIAVEAWATRLAPRLAPPCAGLRPALYMSLGAL